MRPRAYNSLLICPSKARHQNRAFLFSAVMKVLEYLEAAWPYINFILAGVFARIVALRRSALTGKPPTKEQRKADADMCAFGAFGVCFAAWIYFPENFDYVSSIPLGISIGILGVSRVYDLIMRKYGVNNEPHDHTKN